MVYPALRCSVIIPTYNREKLLSMTLSSLERQDVPKAAMEVIVVDDGSNDNTAQVAASFERSLGVKYLYQPDEGFRVAHARNKGISEAAGDICLFVDSGVLLHSGCVRAHLSAHESAQADAAVSGYVFCFNMNNEDSLLISETVDTGDIDGTIKVLEESGRWADIREPWYESVQDNIADAPAPWFTYWTCNASARLDQLRRVGMFDEFFKCWGGEDIDLGYRLHSDGARFIVAREASSIHYPHPKAYEEVRDPSIVNYQYIARKYNTPYARLLNIVPTVDFLTINTVISELVGPC